MNSDSKTLRDFDGFGKIYRWMFNSCKFLVAKPLSFWPPWRKTGRLKFHLTNETEQKLDHFSTFFLFSVIGVTL
jgi:hypothetical protein